MKKMISHHSFNIELACLIGIEKAILLQNIFFWIDYNTKKEVSFFEGKYWTYNSAKEYQKHFPYLNANTIQRYLKQLENENWLISGNFNSNPYDRTKWFALGEKSIEFINDKCIIQNDLSIRQNDECKTQTDECISQNDECITDIIQINKQIVSKEKKASKQKKVFTPPTLEEVIEFVVKEKGYTNNLAKHVFEHYSLADWHDGYGNAVKNWKQKINTNWLKEENKIKYKDSIIETKQESIKKLNPEGKKYYLHQLKKEDIHRLLNKENAREILEAFYGVLNIEDLSQRLDYILGKHDYSATEIWNRK